MKALGAAIRNRRTQLGFTQEELADRMAEFGDANIRQSDISRIERGQVQLPRLERLTCLSQALDISMGELFVLAGWIQDDQFSDNGEDEGFELPIQVSPSPSIDQEARLPEANDTPLEQVSRQPGPSRERFRRNLSEFERVSELYERAKAEHEQRLRQSGGPLAS